MTILLLCVEVAVFALNTAWDQLKCSVLCCFFINLKIIVLNSTVYTYIQVHLVTLTEEKQAKCVKLLNELNESFSMLKYYINGEGNLVLTCSIPAGDDKFDPALLFALLDQVKVHLDTNYSKLMAQIWNEQLQAQL